MTHERHGGASVVAPARLDRARYRRIVRFAARHLAVTWWYEIALPSIGLRRVAARTRAARMQTFARKFRLLAVDLGGLMIKLGQFMSSRLDVLPPEITAELEGLQDEVPAADFADIRALAEAELGVPLDAVYASVDEQPIAAASLGQVYAARLRETDAAHTGFADVVIKVQRPGIGAIVQVDLEALRQVGRWLSRVRLVSNRVDAQALVEEFAQVSLEEIDYLNEGRNSEIFAQNFSGHDHVRVPQVVWERTTRRVLTLEDVSALKITDLDALRAAQIDPAEVAKVFAQVMFDQVFEHGFVHADPHPGNLFITPGETTDGERAWTLTFVDFGMMGAVPSHIRSSLRALIIAAAARDGRRIVSAMNDAGVLLPSADPRALEEVMSQVFARFGGMGIAELREVDPREFRDFALEFRDILMALPFQLPEDFLLVMRAMSLTSGVATALDPRYNIWDSIEPYAQQLLRGEAGNLIADLAAEGAQIARIAWGLPRRVDALLDRMEDGTVEVRSPQVEASLARIERSTRRASSAIVFAALFIGGVLLRTDSPGWGTAAIVASVVPLVAALLGGRLRR